MHLRCWPNVVSPQILHNCNWPRSIGCLKYQGLGVNPVEHSLYPPPHSQGPFSLGVVVILICCENIRKQGSLGRTCQWIADVIESYVLNRCFETSRAIKCCIAEIFLELLQMCTDMKCWKADLVWALQPALYSSLLCPAFLSTRPDVCSHSLV